MQDLIDFMLKDVLASSNLYIGYIEKNLDYYKKVKLINESQAMLAKWIDFTSGLYKKINHKDAGDEFLILAEDFRKILHIWPDMILDIEGAKKQVAILVKKAKKTSWLRMATKSYLTNWKGNEGQLNLFWLILGRPINFNAKESFEKNKDLWIICGKICDLVVDDIQVREYLTTLTIKEFYVVFQENIEVFDKFFPIEKWNYWFLYHRN